MFPSHAVPDMSLLTLVKESEIKRGRVIGSGAFGTVYEVSEYNDSQSSLSLLLLAANN